MLSVQSPGYAGMERFGVDAGLGSPPNHRRKIRSDSVQTHDLLLSADHSIITSKSDSHSSLLAENHHRHYCHHDHHDGIIRCPHHVALPDSDWNPSPDNNSLHLRNSYQQAEITRSYIRPPPNKTALDVPFNYMPDASTIHMNHQRSSAANATTINNKSKHNPLAKFLLRISSPKSHENNSNNTSALPNHSSSYRNNIGNHSSSSSSSSSSTASSVCSSSSLPTAVGGGGSVGGGATSRHPNGPTSKSRSMPQTNLPPSYSESQLQYQQEQRLKFQSITNPPSQIGVSSLSLRTPPSMSSSNNCSLPKINKSRSLCNEINYSHMSISTTPTAMINSIVNNTAIIGSTTSSTMVDETSSTAASTINDLSSINQIEYSINALTDTDINCMVSSNRASSISPSQSNDV